MSTQSHDHQISTTIETIPSYDGWGTMVAKLRRVMSLSPKINDFGDIEEQVI
jgi:hypothetical protein